LESILLDSSAVIAFYNSGDKHHKKIVADISQTSAKFLISTITLTESMVAAFKVSEKESERMLQELTRGFEPFIEVTSQIAMAAAKLRAKTGLATPDAIISASATQASAALWTFDKALAKAHSGSRLIGS
jgi:predicted nucleic acid-binding protein